MQLTLAKWGNSLAVRIPSKLARALSLKEGATLECEATPEGTLELIPADKRERVQWLASHFARTNKRQENMSVTSPAAELLREDARY